MASGSTKIAIRYKDHAGTLRTKHCGNAASVRECVSWLKREGLKFINKETVEGSSAKRTGARQIKRAFQAQR